MITQTQLEALLRRARAINAAGISTPKTNHLIFELGALAAVLKVARDQRSNVELMQGDGVSLPPAQPFVFRNTQSSMSYTAQGPSYFLITALRGRRLEVHNRLQVLGASGQHHEFDVLFSNQIDRSAAGCPVYLSGKDIKFSFECKNYSPTGTSKISIGLMREMLGLMLETGNNSTIVITCTSNVDGGVQNLIHHYGPLYMVHSFNPMVPSVFFESLIKHMLVK